MGARLEKLVVQGLRCLDGFAVQLPPLTALIGANGAGKSSTVRAIEYLFGHVDLDADDPTADLDDVEVAVTGTIAGIPDDWATRLAPWTNDDGTLTLSRHTTTAEDGSSASRWTTYRTSPQGFGDFRTKMSSGYAVTDLKPIYAELQERTGDLPAWKNKTQVLEALTAFEADHPEYPTERAADHSVGFGRQHGVDLSPMMELLVLPAMRDAALDAAQSRGSNLTRLAEITIGAGLDLGEDLRALAERTTREYDQILEGHGGAQLNELAQKITTQLAAFAPGAAVSLDWDSRPMSLPVPPVRAQLNESGHLADIGRQGHGVQRAYVFSLLRTLLDARRLNSPDTQPGLVLVIEEPEVYQHPVRARYVARVLTELAHDPAQSTQVVYTTHSPYFVSVDHIESVRLLRLCPPEGAPEATSKYTRAYAFDPAAAAQKLEVARDGGGRPWSAERVIAQLPGLLDTSVSEGLFANAVALVEGVEDIALIDGAAQSAGVDLAGDGIALVAVSGKPQLPLAWVVFEAFGIPTLVVFDTDDTAGADTSGARWLNKVITTLTDGTGVESPGNDIAAHRVSAHPKLLDIVSADIGEDTRRDAYTACAQEFGLKARDSEKNPHVVRTAIRNLYAEGHESVSLNGIVTAIHALIR